MRFFAGLNDPNIKVKLIHEITLKLLDAFYLKKTAILEQLCRSTVNDVICSGIALLGADYLLLATALILAASETLNKERSNLVRHDIVSRFQCCFDSLIQSFTHLLSH